MLPYIIGSIIYTIFAVTTVRQAYNAWFRADEYLAKSRAKNPKVSLWIDRILVPAVALTFTCYVFSFLLTIIEG